MYQVERCHFIQQIFMLLFDTNFPLQSFGNIFKMYFLVSLKPTVNLALIGFLYLDRKISKEQVFLGTLPP